MKNKTELTRPIVYDTRYMFEARRLWRWRRRVAVIVAPTRRAAREMLTRGERLGTVIRRYRYHSGDFQQGPSGV